jgi:hypothetical protein
MPLWKILTLLGDVPPSRHYTKDFIMQICREDSFQISQCSRTCNTVFCYYKQSNSFRYHYGHFTSNCSFFRSTTSWSVAIICHETGRLYSPASTSIAYTIKLSRLEYQSTICNVFQYAESAAILSGSILYRMRLRPYISPIVARLTCAHFPCKVTTCLALICISLSEKQIAFR